MGFIIGKIYTPYDEDNQRDVVHHETEVDAVVDPVTGIPLRQQLDAITKQLVVVDTDPEHPQPGFITPEMARKYDTMVASSVVISEVKPSSGSATLWCKILPELTRNVPIET